jgi:hypothetical protein
MKSLRFIPSAAFPDSLQSASYKASASFHILLQLFIDFPTPVLSDGLSPDPSFSLGDFSLRVQERGSPIV